MDYVRTIVILVTASQIGHIRQTGPQLISPLKYASVRNLIATGYGVTHSINASGPQRAKYYPVYVF